MCFCAFTRASLFVLGLVILCFVYFHCLIISSSAIDCLEIPLSGMTYYVRSGTLNLHTHSFTAGFCHVQYGCIVSSCADGSLKVWSQRGVEITTLCGHSQKVNGCDLLIKVSQLKQPSLLSSV